MRLCCWKCGKLLAKSNCCEDLYLTPQVPGLSGDYIELQCSHNSKGKRCKALNYLASAEPEESLNA